MSIINDMLKAIDNIDPTALIIVYYYIDYRLKHNYQNQNNSMPRYSLKKDERPLKNIKEVLLPPELKINTRKVDFRKLAKKEFGEEIVKFADIMIKNFSSSNLINFYNNINELNIKDKSKFDKKNVIYEVLIRITKNYNNISSYEVSRNRLDILAEDKKINMPHELFHMSSSYYDSVNNTIYGGFSELIDEKDKNKHRKIGVGFNEGYTEYMVEKYYGKEYTENSNYNYNLLRKIAHLIEHIIGKEKMEFLYLNANLKGLIDELSSYIGEEDALNFINSTDYLFRNVNSNKITKLDEEKLEKHLQFVSYIIISLGTQKAVRMYENEEITFYDIINNINNNILYIPTVTINNKKYEIPSGMTTLIVSSILNSHGIKTKDIKEQEKTK